MTNYFSDQYHFCDNFLWKNIAIYIISNYFVSTILVHTKVYTLTQEIVVELL